MKVSKILIRNFTATPLRNKLLSYEMTGNPNAPRTAVFLHGIVGSKRNWRTPSQQLVQKYPQFKTLSVDHRGHGDSHNHCDDHSIEKCAKDLKILFNHLNITPSILCGHSFGGKVALTYISNQIKTNQPIPKNTWIIDSIPGLHDTQIQSDNNQSVQKVFHALEVLPKVFISRDWMVSELQVHDIPKPVAQWLGTNIVPSGNGNYTWAFNLTVLKDLYEDFCQLDLWPFLRNFSSDEEHIHFIRAGKNPAWTDEVLHEFENLYNPNVQLHHMPHVGHWVHVEDLEGLLSIIHSQSKH